MLANRKLSVSPSVPSTFLPRWHPIGKPVLETPGYSGSPQSRRVRCDLASQYMNFSISCGLTQTVTGDGFNSGMSSGSAIDLRKGTQYTARVLYRTTGSATLSVSVGSYAHTFHIVATAGTLAGGDSLNSFHNATFDFTAKEDQNNATFSVEVTKHDSESEDSTSTTTVWFGSTSLMPTAAARPSTTSMPPGIRPDVVASLREINFRGLLRYPGGCFAPFYKFEKDLTPNSDESPSIATPPTYCAAVKGGVNAYTDGLLENSLNTDNYMKLVRVLGMVPAITISLQYGTDDEIRRAKEWVEYCNGNESTTMGLLRQKRTLRNDSYNVKYWYLGNEINQQARYANYPNSTKGDPQPKAQEYASMIRKVTTAMLAVDPTIEFLGVGSSTVSASWMNPWLKALSSVGGTVSGMSWHGGYLNNNPTAPADFVQDAMVPTRSLYKTMQQLRTTMDQQLVDHNLSFSMDEWGLGPPWEVQSFNVGHAMYGASFFSLVVREHRRLNIRFTNYFEAINEGAIKVQPYHSSGSHSSSSHSSHSSHSSSRLTPLGQVMQMYARHQGRASLSAPVTGVDNDDLVTTASWSDSGGDVLIIVANRNTSDYNGMSLNVTTPNNGTTYCAKKTIVTTLTPDGALGPTTSFLTKKNDVPVVPVTKTLVTLKIDVPGFSVVQLSLQFGMCL